MKIWRLVVAALLTAVLLSLVACGSDSPQSKFSLADMHGGTTKAWKTISSTWQYNPDGSIPITGTDDLIIINSDGTAMKVWGEIAKAGETTKVDFYNWSVNGDKLTFIGVEDAGNMEATIITLTDQVFIYDLQLEIPGAGSFTVRTVSIPTVYPNATASSENKMLTNGTSKLWKVAQRTKDGVALPLETWKQDDMWLYNTDGTGMFLRGEISETPGAPANNDAFLWQFTDNKTKIDTENSENPGEVFDSKIIELTNTSFVYEATINGSVIRISAVPVVK